MKPKIKMNELEEFMEKEFKAHSCTGEYENIHGELIYRVYSYTKLILEKKHNNNYPHYFDNTFYSKTTSKVQNAIINYYFEDKKRMIKKKKYINDDIFHEILSQ